MVVPVSYTHLDVYKRQAVSRRPPEQKEKRYADQRPAGEADQLPLGQVESNLCFDFG